MVVRVEQDKGKHINFYEGTHIGFHPNWESVKGGEHKEFGIIVEGLNTSITVSLSYDGDTRIFLMNDRGDTIDSKYL